MQFFSIRHDADLYRRSLMCVRSFRLNSNGHAPGTGSGDRELAAAGGRGGGEQAGQRDQTTGGNGRRRPGAAAPQETQRHEEGARGQG